MSSPTEHVSSITSTRNKPKDKKQLQREEIKESEADERPCRKVLNMKMKTKQTLNFDIRNETTTEDYTVTAKEIGKRELTTPEFLIIKLAEGKTYANVHRIRDKTRRIK